MTKTVIPRWVLVVLLPWLPSSALAESAALAAAGKRQFIRCAPCHALSAEEPARFGPHLEDIVGRRAGTVADFDYSDPKLQEQSFVWDEAYIEEWLQAPQAEYPAMCLPFTGIAKAEVRSAIIVYLRDPIP